mmetsp:Transcript_33078/g.33680  ORF Transcript_33078/g.33680 Transcript_33078/m.33680 type:complete len:196 (-) Transcript_33078:106-693(-)
MAEFEVLVSKEDFRFSCAHFIAYHGFRERIHGHNYTASVRAVGGSTVGPDGYVIDFGEIKKVTRKVCKELNELFICPINSNVLNITEEKENINIECEDGAKFSFPKGDCAVLPIVHSSAEEIACFLWIKIVRELGLEVLLSRGINKIEVSVSEAPMQTAYFRCVLPENNDKLIALENELKYCSRDRKPPACFDTG